MKRLRMAYLYFQVFSSVFVILFGVSSSIRSLVEGSDIFYVICFAAIGFIGYKFLYRESIKELKEERSKK